MLPEGWKKSYLREIISTPIKNGYSPVSPAQPTGKWVLGLGALTPHGLDKTKIKPAPLNDKRVDQAILESGDFLVSRSNTPDKVGESALFRGEVDNCSYPDLMMRFRLNENIAKNEFIECVLRSEDIRNYIKRSASGTSETMVKITKSTLEKLPINLPPVSEQLLIAQIASTLDCRIANVHELIAQKQAYKRNLMQRLLTGKLRFPEFASQPWHHIQLGKISSIIKKTPLTSVDGETLLTVKLYCKGIERNERITARLSEKGRPYFRRHAGEFIVGRQNFHNGGFAILPAEMDGLIASSAITSFKIDAEKALDKFVFYYLSREEYYSKAGDRIGGTGQKEFSDKELMALPINLPSLAEQRKIAAVLSAADRKIDQLTQKLDAYKLQKKGLMQQLLTGKKRVGIAKSEAA